MMPAYAKILLFGVATCAMLAAVVFQMATVTTGDYRRTLLEALGLMLLADACFGVIVWRGGFGWRVAALVAMLPSVFILADFATRAPRVFSKGNP
jgi:hypothetical protein